MPPSDFQARVLRLIADNRSPTSHVAGGLSLNMDFSRFSFDIDIFHDVKAELIQTAEADARTLRNAGLTVTWFREFPTMRSARVSGPDGQTELDWAVDSDFRFFPTEPDDRLGWRLHSFDLATNKALAAAARREPRDAIDLVEIHERLFPLGAVVWAAVAKDPGFSPLSLLDWIGRFSRYQDDDLAVVRITPRWTAADLSRRLKSAISEAQAFVDAMPADQAGRMYLKDGRIVQPDPADLASVESREATRGGVWPIDPSLPITPA